MSPTCRELICISIQISSNPLQSVGKKSIEDEKSSAFGKPSTGSLWVLQSSFLLPVLVLSLVFTASLSYTGEESTTSGHAAENRVGKTISPEG